MPVIRCVRTAFVPALGTQNHPCRFSWQRRYGRIPFVAISQALDTVATVVHELTGLEATA
jgi:hypothetical protein